MPHDRVCVYRNLNARDASETWSIASVSGRSGKGTKRGAAASLVLANVTMHVQPGAAAKLAAGAQRSVHAWFIGDKQECRGCPAHLRRVFELAYNPRRDPTRLYFHDRQTGNRIEHAGFVELASDGRAYVLMP